MKTPLQYTPLSEAPSPFSRKAFRTVYAGYVAISAPPAMQSSIFQKWQTVRGLRRRRGNRKRREGAFRRRPLPNLPQPSFKDFRLVGRKRGRSPFRPRKGKPRRMQSARKDALCNIRRAIRFESNQGGHAFAKGRGGVLHIKERLAHDDSHARTVLYFMCLDRAARALLQGAGRQSCETRPRA